MTERPDYSAPSPADGPTERGMPAVPRESGAPVDAPTTSIAPEAAGPSVAPDAPTTAIPPTPPGGVPRGQGRAGSEPAPPTDPPTDPGTEPRRISRPGTERRRPGRTRMSGTWIGVILGAVLLIFLLVFILQNLDPARVTFLGLEATLPLGIWLLFAAVAGVLLLAVPGLGRMLQWRRATASPRPGRRGR